MKGKFKGMSIMDLHRYVGSDPMIHINVYHAAEENPRVRVKHNCTNNTRETVYETPDGTLIRRDVFSKDTQTWHPDVYPIHDLESLKAARYLYEGIEYHIDKFQIANINLMEQNLSEKEWFYTTLGRTPVMDLVEYMMGIENFSYIMYDHPIELNELIEIMQDSYLKRWKINLENTRIENIVAGEDTSTTLISPTIFEKYCLPHLRQYGEMISGQFGKNFIVHMCGKIKALMPLIDKIPAIAIEAVSTPPVGDVTIKEALEGMPSKTVCGGSNASIWNKPYYEAARIILEDIQAAGDVSRLYLSSGGTMPIEADPENVKMVWETVLKEMHKA
ncbi:MAG TPA: hypothetical protein GX505_09505 [Clostridiales bacterium]|nr:hypothetical protein [Clostridiales bacterium]